MILISNLTLNIKDGSTIASTNIYGADKKTYINIGSGNVFKLEWVTPVLTNDNIDRYSLVIKRYYPTLNVYYDIFDKNIGLVNEFFVDSPMLPALPEQYMLSIYLVAYGKQGSVVTSNVINPYISKGSGTYVKVEGDESITYKQPIMKRALAFANVPTPDEKTVRVVDSNGNEVPILDSEGSQVQLEATRILSSETWNVMQEGYTKAADGTWRATDIKYEVLVDETGDIIVDSNNKPIYVL